MSTPAAFSGAAYVRTASAVSEPYGSSPSISGTSRGHATGTSSTPASSARTSSAYRPLATVASVASRPIRRLRVASTAACASGARTPMTGTSRRRWRSGSAAAVAELQAATTSFTPWRSR